MSYNSRKNYLTGNILSDEWYTPKFLVDKCLELVDLKDKIVICPFDTDNSIFVQDIKQKRCIKDLIYNIRDFMDKKYIYDVLITNPPFSIKEQVFEKCLQNNQDFILVLPETFIFSVGFYNLIEKYNFHYKLYSPKQRVYFIDEQGKQNRPNFHTIIIYVSKSFKYNTIEHFYSETK